MRDDYLSYLARNEDRQPQRQPEPDLPSASDDDGEGRITVRPKVRYVGNDEADRIEMQAMSGSNEDTPQIRLLTQMVTLLETLPERLVSAMREG